MILSGSLTLTCRRPQASGVQVKEELREKFSKFGEIGDASVSKEDSQTHAPSAYCHLDPPATLYRILWSLFDGTWNLMEGSWKVLAYEVYIPRDRNFAFVRYLEKRPAPRKILLYHRQSCLGFHLCTCALLGVVEATLKMQLMPWPVTTDY